MATTTASAKVGAVRDEEQRIGIPGVSWKEYLLLNEAIDTPGVRMAYCEGVLEIMTVSRRHEWLKKVIARLIETWALERDVALHGYGSTTFRDEAHQRGVEPDECWVVGSEMKEYPEIVLEVVLSPARVDKLAIYGAMRVQEVWFWRDDRFELYRLGPSGWEPIERSASLPVIDFRELARLVALEDQHAALRQLREQLRSPRP